MDNLALELQDSSEESAVSPDPAPPTEEGAPTGDPGVVANSSPVGDPNLKAVEPPPPKKKTKRGGKRPGAGRPKKKKASPFNVSSTTDTSEKGKAPDEIAIGGFADMGHVAAVGTAALDGVIVGVARMRYGENADALHANKKALADIQAAMLIYLEHTAVQITPGQALLVAIAAAYGPPAMALEIQKRQEKKAQRAQ